MTATATGAGGPAAGEAAAGEAAAARGGRGLAAAAGLYLLLAVGLWWGVWASHPTATATCGCGDAARFLWFFGWPPYALAHGHGLFWSPWLFHPTGLNLLDDTSVLALSVLLAPLTAAAGPVLAMNVGLTLAPALSALALFALVRRWVRWWPAAVLGGLVYGFSPFVVTELALNQLNIAFLAVPPLVVLVLGDLVVDRHRPPVVDGALLAGLVVVQFFLSTEVLLITAVAAVAGVAVLAVAAAVRAPDVLRARLRPVATGVVVAVGLAGAVLAYPLWFALRGPAHLAGPVWANGGTARFGTTVASLWSTAGLGPLQAGMAHFGGYQGPALPGLGYLGLGVVVVAGAGAVAFRRDGRIRFFSVLGVAAFLCSLAPGHGVWVPWQALGHLPLVGDIVEGRVALVVTGCAAVVVALVVDRVHDRATRVGPGGPRASRPAGLLPWALVALVLVPSAIVLAPNLPLTVRPVVLPTWFATAGATLPPGRVVLAYPVPFSGLQSSQAWQAVDAMRWAQAGGGGPQGTAARAGTAAAGFTVLAAASLPLGPAPAAGPSELAAVRRALAAWGVTTAVVPGDAGLAPYDRGRGAAFAVAYLTAAFGVRPAYDHRAWVWDHVRAAPPPAPVPPAAFARCTSAAVAGRPAPQAVPDCILAAAGAAAGA